MRAPRKKNRLSRKALLSPRVKLYMKKGGEIPEDFENLRPKCREDCVKAPRPCPWVGCRHHLFIEVTEVGSIRFQFPSLELGELRDTCSLDVAERGGLTLDDVSDLLNCTRERVRLIEKEALDKIFCKGSLE